MTTFKINKINELIKQALAELILRELTPKNGVFITISKVDTTEDLLYSNVFVSVFPEKEIPYIKETLRKEKGHLQKLLGSHIRLRRTPGIVFKIDQTEAKAELLEKIIQRPDF